VPGLNEIQITSMEQVTVKSVTVACENVAVH
jgi:hypothetical protein